MSITTRVLFVILVCTSTSGCLLPMSIGLLSKPIGYLIDQHEAKQKAEAGTPISVASMLASARGDDGSLEELPDPENADQTCQGKPGSISVAQMLEAARAKQDTNTAEPIETAKSTAPALLTPIAHAPEVNKQEAEVSVVIGTYSSDKSPAPAISLLMKARDVCKRLGDTCDPAHIKMDTTLPLGTLQISPLDGDRDA